MKEREREREYTLYICGRRSKLVCFSLENKNEIDDDACAEMKVSLGDSRIGGPTCIYILYNMVHTISDSFSFPSFPLFAFLFHPLSVSMSHVLALLIPSKPVRDTDIFFSSLFHSKTEKNGLTWLNQSFFSF